MAIIAGILHDTLNVGAHPERAASVHAAALADLAHDCEEPSLMSAGTGVA